MIEAERMAASRAIELIAAGAEECSAGLAGSYFEDDVASVCITLEGKIGVERIAGGAGCRSGCHVDNYSKALS